MHPTTKKSTRILFAPLIKFTEWMGIHHPVTLVKIRYFARFHRFPNLKNPKDLNEKILWLKLFSDISLWTRCADKYEVRKYVEECGMGQHLVKLYGRYTNAEDFHLDELPDSFILKANNGMGNGEYIVVKDKSKHTELELQELIDSWFKRKNVGALCVDKQYYNIKPCAIAEELLPIEKGHISLVDYKIWCFNGKPYYIWTCSDRDNFGTEVMTYDTDWNPMPEVSIFDKRYRKGKVMDKPKNLDKMLHIAEVLSKPFPQVRMDLYNIEGEIYFGETTFTSLGGMMDFYTPEFLLEMGSKVDLNYKG